MTKCADNIGVDEEWAHLKPNIKRPPHSSSVIYDFTKGPCFILPPLCCWRQHSIILLYTTVHATGIHPYLSLQLSQDGGTRSVHNFSLSISLSTSQEEQCVSTGMRVKQSPAVTAKKLHFIGWSQNTPPVTNNNKLLPFQYSTLERWGLMWENWFCSFTVRADARGSLAPIKKLWVSWKV